MPPESFRNQFLRLLDMADNGNPLAQVIVARLAEQFYMAVAWAQQAANLDSYVGEGDISQLSSSSQE